MNFLPGSYRYRGAVSFFRKEAILAVHCLESRFHLELLRLVEIRRKRKGRRKEKEKKVSIKYLQESSVSMFHRFRKEILWIPNDCDTPSIACAF